MTSSYQNVILLFLFRCGILQFTPSQVRTKQYYMLLHKLLLKVLTVTTPYVHNSVILFYILCLHVVHIGAVVVMQQSYLCLLALVGFVFCILIVTKLVLWLQDFNKLTY